MLRRAALAGSMKDPWTSGDHGAIRDRVSADLTFRDPAARNPRPTDSGLDSLVEHERDEHVHLVLGDGASVQAHLLLLDPRALDVAERLVRAVETRLDRVLEARGRRRADLRHSGDWHVASLSMVCRGESAGSR